MYVGIKKKKWCDSFFFLSKEHVILIIFEPDLHTLGVFPSKYVHNIATYLISITIHGPANCN